MKIISLRKEFPNCISKILNKTVIDGDNYGET